MKKVIALILMLFVNSNVFGAATYSKMFNIVFRNDLHYASYIFIKKAIQRGEKINSKKAQIVIDTIHPSVFIHDYDLDQFVTNSTELDFPVALRRFFLNDFTTAKRKLVGINKNNTMYVESNYILGLIYLTENDQERAEKHFKRCVRYAATKTRAGIKTEQYISTFKNRCIQQVARISFAQKNHKKALKVLDYVRKIDYIWPRFLLDKAWSYYWSGDNERALGTVITFKAPHLQRYMVPEANYLRALIYYEMCYFEKAEKIYAEFNRNTWNYRKYAKTASRNKLLKFIKSPTEPETPGDKFLYYYLKGYKKDIRYFTYMDARQQLASEIKKLARIRSLSQARIFLNNLYYYHKAIKEDYQDFLKNLASDYYLQIRQMRNAFVKLSLMISLKKRKKIAMNESSKLEDGEIQEIDFDEIKDTDDKYIWNFLGGFWADELGDYAVALKNKCSAETPGETNI